MRDVADSIDRACADLGERLATLPAWENALGPPDRDGESYRGPALLGEGDCRMHLVRMLARYYVDDPRWLHQEVPTSAYLFPGWNEQSPGRKKLLDIGIVDPQRLKETLTRDEMRGVSWNALIEVKFRGLRVNKDQELCREIEGDLRKLASLRDHCDHAYVILVDEVEMPPFATTHEDDLQEIASAVDVHLRFVRAADLRATR